MHSLKITEDAQAHFLSLLQQERMPGMALRVFVEEPGTPKAEVAIAFCPPGAEQQDDLLIAQHQFNLYIAANSADLLKEAHIDYQEQPLGGQLVITAPHIKGSKPDACAPLADRLNYILESQVNPSLAQHKGKVSLVEITPDKIVVLKFGGGCHGCGMVDITLKNGIERTLKEQLPEINAVRDVTDHSTGTEPYYA